MNTCSHEMLVVMGGQKSNVSCVNIVNNFSYYIGYAQIV